MKAALATPEPIIAPAERGFARLALLVATFGALWFVLCRQLSGEWSVNEQYTYGWFVPFFCAYLFWLRWEDRPEPEARGQRSEVGDQRPEVRSPIAIALAVVAFLLLFPLRVFEIGNPDWRPLDWIHAAIVVTVTLLALWWAGGRAWLRHFAFPVAFIFAAVPWISPVEHPVVQGLMRAVAAAATEALALCGIPAQVEGNLIRISSGVVGVNEACSGVRALQTALMIGLLFGELKRFSPSRRVGLVVVAIALSILANFVRTFLLVLVAAHKGIGAVDRWHDVAGYSIVVLVFLGTMAAAAFLRRDQRLETGNLVTRHSSLVTFARPSFLAPVLVWIVFVEISSAAWYRVHERNLVPRMRWSVSWPAGEQGFRELKINESVRQTLRFDEGRSARWYAPTTVIAGNDAATESPAIPRLHCTLFFFRWNAGGGTLLRARAHRPEICLPSAGWEQSADDGTRLYQTQPGLTLPFRHFEFVHKQRSRFESDQFAHTFFCLEQDWMEPENSAGARTAVVRSRSRDWGVLARVRAVEQGLRDLGQQTMELVFVTSQPLSKEAAEEKFAAQLPELVHVERLQVASE